MTISNPTTEKPGMVTTIAVITLVNGILNILLSLGITASTVVGTFGLGLLCAPVTVLPGILGIFEVIYATKLLANPPRPVRPSQTIAILEICCFLVGNIISVVVGILALVFYNEPAVKAYFAMINGQPAPVPPSARPEQFAQPALPIVSEPERPEPAAPLALPSVTEPEQPMPTPTAQPALLVATEPKQAKPEKKPARPKSEQTKQTKKAAKPKVEKLVKPKSEQMKQSKKTPKPKAEKPEQVEKPAKPEAKETGS